MAVLVRGNYDQWARKFISLKHTSHGTRTIQYYRDSFWHWENNGYSPIKHKTVKIALWKFLSDCTYLPEDNDSKAEKILPRDNMLPSLMLALEAACYIDDRPRPPFWIDQDGPNPLDILPVRNGLLHIPSGQLLEPTPSLFSTNPSPVTYDPLAPIPHQWLQFLQDLFEHDPVGIDALQEWFGYNLTWNTRFQKILLMIGPKRAGKGTIGRVLEHLLGQENMGSISFHDISQQFGLQQLIGKSASLVPDVRISRSGDSTLAVERLLTISGEDSTSIQRKFLPPWIGGLRTRFTMMTNDLLKVDDASGALLERLIVLNLVKSYASKVDPYLLDRLITELPGILNWSMEGYQQLIKNNHFHQPISSVQTVEETRRINSPVMGFIEDQCIVGPEYSISTQSLYRAYEQWCTRNGRKCSSADDFGRDLRSALSSISVTRPREGTKRVRTYSGITLESQLDSPDNKVVSIRGKQLEQPN